MMRYIKISKPLPVNKINRKNKDLGQDKKINRPKVAMMSSLNNLNIYQK